MNRQSCSYKAAKLLICAVGRGRGDQLMTAAKTAGARGGTVIAGRAVSKNKFLEWLSLADVDQDLVFTIMGQETEAVLAAVLAEAQKSKKLEGKAILLDVTGMLFRVPGQEREEQEREKIMSGYQLITIIVNQGYADDVMATARRAGAHGGTIVGARGTGTEDDVKFFGISLVPEKEMILIVAANEDVPKILAAVEEEPNIKQPGGGIVFHLNIEQFNYLGSREDI